MEEKQKNMMEKIQDGGRVGYAYYYPCNNGERQEFYISTIPENIANFIGSHYEDAEKMIITDILDRFILDTAGGFIDRCPDQELCREILSFLIPIQMGEKDAGEILAVTRDVAEVYFMREDEEATMSEYGLM